jgi:PAS domain S-box-containing protein
MVVEDEAVIALKLQQMLTKMGYDVIGVSYSGEEALEKARSLRPDLILMDIMIPGKLDGINVAEIVKSELDIPVIFLTAFSEDKIIERAKKAEPFGYILKPFQDREIKATIEVAFYKKEMENALKESEEKFRALAENANEGILVCKERGEHVYANKRAAEITGYSVSELLKTKIKDLAHPDEFEKIKERYCTIISGKPFNRQYETTLIRKNGKEVPIEVASARTRWEGKDADIAIFRDITNRIKAEEALWKSHKELENRVKERTFELNNALTTIQGSEKELTQRKIVLEKLNKELVETNQALSILARNIDKDKELLEKRIYEITSTNMMPIIKELQDDKSCQKRLADLELLKTYLNGLIPGPTYQHEIIVRLSSQEIRVAVMIKRGLTSPIIADMLNVSLHTVKTHRKNIRKKLNLQNSDVNLTSYLRSKFRE